MAYSRYSTQVREFPTMALLQTKTHGVVETHKVKSMDAAHIAMRNMVDTARSTGYVVSVCPGMAVMVCPEHKDGSLPVDADYCYIIAVSSGRKAK